MFCSKCGKQLKDDDIFCSSCGNKVAEVSGVKVVDNIKKENKNSYVLVMAVIMMALLFTPFYQIIRQDAYDIEGWMNNAQQTQESVSLINVAKDIFHPNITEAANYFLVFFSFILAMGAAVGICVCSVLFLYELYQKKGQVNVSYVSANAILSAVFAGTVLFMNFSFEKLCQELYADAYYMVFEFSTKPIVWVLVAIAWLNNLVIYELYSKDTKEEKSV